MPEHVEDHLAVADLGRITESQGFSAEKKAALYGRLQRKVSRQVLSIYREFNSTTSLFGLFQCFVNLAMKTFLVHVLMEALVIQLVLISFSPVVDQHQKEPGPIHSTPPFRYF